MKKLFKKISVMLLALTLSFSAFVGCNEPQREADQVLEVFIANRGYGIDGVLGALGAFEKQAWVKEKYPNLEIKPLDERTPNYGLQKLKSPKNNQFDLIFVIEDLVPFFGKNSKGQSTLVELTDVFNSTVPNENVTVLDKMLDVSRDYVTWINPEGNIEYYDVSWVTGYTGMVYNPRLFANYVEHDPRTTQELLDLLVKIKNGDTILEKPAGMSQKEWNKLNCGNEDGFGIAPCGSATYDSALFEAWWAQYDGYDEYNDFWEGYYYDESIGMRSQSNKVFQQKGRLYSLQVLREILDYDKAYYDLGLSEYNFMVGQTTFLKGEYPMTNCSDWYDSEMKLIRKEMKAEYEAGVEGAINPENLLILKAPIISEVVHKLAYRQADNTSYMTDEQLSFLVGCIDERMDFDAAFEAFHAQWPADTNVSKNTLKEKDYDRLLEARAISRGPGISHTVCIPSVSNSIDVAKDFLRFMATDVCQLAYMEGSEGQNLPFHFDPNSTAPLYGTEGTVADGFAEVYTKCSPMQQPRLTEIMYNTFNPIKILLRSERRPLSGVGYKAINLSGDIGRVFRVKEAPSAQSVFEETTNNMTEDRFRFLLFEAGLSDSY